MIRSGIAVLSLTALGLFGFYFATNRSAESNVDKAKSAGLQVLDTAKEKGVSLLVDGRLKSQFGFEATRFLHTYFDDGRLIVYGMAPVGVDLQELHDVVAKVAGVGQVDVLVTTRPAHVVPLPTFSGNDGTESPQDASAGD